MSDSGTDAGTDSATDAKADSTTDAEVDSETETTDDISTRSALERMLEDVRGEDGGVSLDPEDSPFPDCPRCGRPVTRVTSTGPMDHTASPCGCRVSGNLLE